MEGGGFATAAARTEGPNLLPSWPVRHPFRYRRRPRRRRPRGPGSSSRQVTTGRRGPGTDFRRKGTGDALACPAAAQMSYARTLLQVSLCRSTESGPCPSSLVYRGPSSLPRLERTLAPGLPWLSLGFIRPSAGRAQISRRLAIAPSMKLCACAARCLSHNLAEREEASRVEARASSSLYARLSWRLERIAQLYAR